MKTDHVDESMSRLLETAAPQMSAGWQARAVERLTATRPARGISRRLVLAAVGVAALVGLGFVPIPMGKAPGALERALAAAEQATTVHMTGHAWTTKGEWDLDRWDSADGFSRQEKCSAGKLVELNITQGDRVLWYLVDPETGQTSATEDFWPTNRIKFGELPAAEGKSYLARMFDSLEMLHRDLGVAAPEVEMTEHRERGLWRGAVDVVEAVWSVQGNASISGVNYREGDRVRVRAEVDPDTNRLLSMSQYKFEGTWEPTYRADYEWDVPIPDAGEFRPPKGTRLNRHTWWQKRADQTIAAGTTQDWDVVLHAVDVNRRGDVVLSLHRAPRPESKISRWQDGSLRWRVEAADDAGVSYRVGGGGPWGSYFLVSYGTATLVPEHRDRNARSVTLTVYPYPRGQTTDQSVTFRSIPLPPRQNTDDLFAAETEVIQY
jgi:hypothetical protein